MTIYSHHPHRGKVQILATYRGTSGIASSTVTSVDSTDSAAPVVDALNRISAYATVPVSIYDTRYGPVDHFPTDHIAALTDISARPQLLKGHHSLWYVMATWFLHQALVDLDMALEDVPAPVCTAVYAELEAESGWLRSELADANGDEGIPVREDDQRLWDREAALVDASGFGLDEYAREMLERLDTYATKTDLATAAGDLRTLLEAYEGRPSQGFISLSLEGLVIFVEPDVSPRSEDTYYLEVGPPISSEDEGRDAWTISLGRWEVDEVDEDGEETGSTGSTFLDATFPERPTSVELGELLAVSHDQLLVWAKAEVGDVLEGTALVVTTRLV